MREQTTPAEVARVLQALRDSGFFALDARYASDDCCDFSAHTIAVTTSTGSHTVYCYNECPDTFEAVRRWILDLWPYDIPVDGFA
jgi:hypothetical protein